MQQPLTEDIIKKAANDSDLLQVYKLDLSILNLTRICSLEIVPKLKCLILSYNKLKFLQGLRVLPQLKELHAQSNFLSKISGLEINKNLSVLNLSGNAIEKIENISHLTRLESLLLKNNELARLSGLDSLKQLKILNLSGNKIEYLEFIPAFSKLEYINLSQNKIKVILPNFFQNCNKLLKLDLSKNQLKKSDFITCLENLESLDLSYNKLEVFEPQTVYFHMETLNLAGNNISQLPYFPSLFPDLMTLNLAENMVTNEVTLLHSIAAMESLVDLDFRGNPMFSQTFESAMMKIHNLDVINGKPVNNPGNKYKQKIQTIVNQFREFPQVYMRDDQEDRQIKNSGFYSQELQLEMTGLKPNRPPSPIRKTAVNDDGFLKSQQEFREWLQQTNQKVNNMRSRYLDIMKNNGIVLPVAEPEPQKQEFISAQPSAKNISGSIPGAMSLDAMLLQAENEKNKWKEIKARDKGFNIRDVKKRKSQADQNMSNNSRQEPHVSLSKFQKKPNQMLKTQYTAFDQKLLAQAQLARTQQKNFRPQSLKR